MNRKIILKKVTVHNLKAVDLTLEPNQLIVFTGVSGSGKSSLAFDTIYVEGQRRYIESLSTFARRHLTEMAKPSAEYIDGISPTIAIEQKTAGKNPRSTVGTMTGIYDYLRVLFAKVAIFYCPVSGQAVSSQSAEHILRKILTENQNAKIIVLSPFIKGKKGALKEEFAELMRKGYTRIRLDKEIIDLSEKIAIDNKAAHDIDLVIDRLVVKEEEKNRLTEAVTKGLETGNGLLVIFYPDSNQEELFSQYAYSPKSGLSYEPLEPQHFSFNHPLGMCPHCQGLGSIFEFKIEKIIDEEKSIAEDCCNIASSYTTVRFGNIFDNLARLYDFKVTTPWKNLSAQAKHAFLYGSEEKWIKMVFSHPTKQTKWIEYVEWKGVINEARKRYQDATSDAYKANMQELMEEKVCSECKGARIRAYPAAAKFKGKTIHEVCAFSIEKCLDFFSHLTLNEEESQIAEEVVKEIKTRLFFLFDVGLHYLALERTAPTLSGGESQRVRLASQIGSGLSHATYILDEPSIGLHPQDNSKLLASLRTLCARGNTVIVVEHDEETIYAADHIVDVGPLAGALGGEIIVSGTLQDLLQNPRSITASYLTGKQKIPVSKKRKVDPDKFLLVEKASHHNLKNLDVKIPLGILIAVTGVSGSGKSSLITDILYPALANAFHHAKMKVGKHHNITGLDQIDKVIAIDQSAIGKTPRSNPATYIKVFDAIRDLFAKLPEAEAQGYKAGRFSFNVKEGCCSNCEGFGMVKIDMDFMEDEWVTCQECKGKRFDQKTLSVLYKGKNIHEILEMTISESLSFFEAIPAINKKLEMLSEVGLGYIKLGQSSPTLSGGEAQRIKLAKELCRPSTGKTLYILDEPTTGLHFYDIHKLVEVLQRLVDKKNTVLIIEHNMDLVKTADWIIDLGPKGGEFGGEIVACNTPEKIAKMDTATGKAVYNALYPEPLSLHRPSFQTTQPSPFITVEKAEQNNLKAVSATIPHGKITVCSGPSGSGKSSFAFETVYAEGQRRYTESMSAYARQFVKQMAKPKAQEIHGLLAAIAIEQKNHAGNPRSTIGTMTEVYDYLRILFAHLGVAYAPETGEKICAISKEYVLDKLLQLPEKTKIQILAPIELKEPFETLTARLLKEGFLRIRINQEFYELDEPIAFDKKRKNTLSLVIDRLVIGPAVKKRLYDAIDLAASLGKNTLIAYYNDQDAFYNLAFADPTTGKSYPLITPHTFSFNTAQGMCLDCMGLGMQYSANLQKYRSIMRLTTFTLMEKLWKEESSRKALSLLEDMLEALQIDPYCPLQKLPSQHLQILLNGSAVFLKKKGYQMYFNGIGPVFAKLAKTATSSLKQELSEWVDEIVCNTCQGTRLNPLARHVLINKHSIADVCHLPICQALAFVEKIPLKEAFLKETLSYLTHKLQFLEAIGLGYLSLDRSAPSLSGGETQRIRLARQLGSGLTGCLYVLDEPTIGLHPHNNHLLNASLKKLCALGNTILLVEHDPSTIQIADYILDFGPSAGNKGGHIIARGTLEQIKADPHSLTGAYLSKRKTIEIPAKRKSFSKTITIQNATLHNLKNLTIDLPIGVFTCITGVSGSGKSTLLNDLLRPATQQFLATLYKKQEDVVYKEAKFLGLQAFNKLLFIDQNPIGHTIRADVTTYANISSPLREFFAQLPEAKVRGLLPKNFSFNHIKGMCTKCAGLGKRKIEMQFLPPVRVECDMCKGYRLNPLSLQVKIKDKHFGHLLQMTVEEALNFLPVPKILRILETLASVGLGYLQLGQEIASLSGGEAQRLRLATELAKRSTGKTLYLFDEPTIGLHSEDIVKLLKIFHTLVQNGNTVILIEHNLDVIANADYVIDIGPDAGQYGGEVVAYGTPEIVAHHPNSYTAAFLKQVLF